MRDKPRRTIAGVLAVAVSAFEFFHSFSFFADLARPGKEDQRQHLVGEPPVHMIWRESVLGEDEFVDFSEGERLWIVASDFINETWR